jgi:1-acyl-sn-glycerol-3-phosphate acyltransferase
VRRSMAGARRIAKRVKRTVQSAVGFGYFWVGGTAIGAIALPLASIGAKDELDRVRRCQRVVQRLSRHYHRVVERLGVGTIDVDTYAAAVPKGPCVVVANHPTILDVVLFLAAHEHLCVVAKGELFRGPFVGPLLRSCGHIDAGDGGEMEGAAVIRAAMERLEAGFSVLIFPEGTRSPPEGMFQFKRGAFELATRAQVPLLPVFIRCDPPVLVKGVPWWKTLANDPFRLRLQPLPLMDWRLWEGDTRSFRKRVHRLVRDRVEAWHGERIAAQVGEGAMNESPAEDCGPAVTVSAGRARA